MRSLALFLVVTTMLFGCEKVIITDENIVTVSDREMATALSEDGTMIVDVRKPEQFAAGHIPNAINIYLPTIRSSDERLAGAKKIIVYGKGGNDPLSQAATKRMLSLGYQGVEEYKGGMRVWETTGQQVVKSTAPAQARPETQPQK